jgi:hypothetical protein
MVRRSWTLFASPLAQPQPVFTGCAHAPCFHEGQHAGFSPTRRVFTRRSLSHEGQHAGFSPTRRVFTRRSLSHSRFHWLCTHGRSLPPYALGRSLPPSAGLYRRANSGWSSPPSIGFHRRRVGLVFTALGRSLPPYALGRSLPPSAGLYRRATAQPQPVFTGCAHASCFILVIILVGFLTIVFDCFLCLVSPCGRAGRCCCFQLLDGAVLRRRCCCCFQLLLRRQSEERRCCFLIYAVSV